MKELKRTIGIFALVVLCGLSSCKHDGNSSGLNEQGRSVGIERVDEDVILPIAEADLIQLEDKPQYNTAEWLLRVDKPGRYDVWLSSLTIDSTQLRYADKVIITAGETKLEKKPVGERIVTEGQGHIGPWYRAESHMGSVLFAKPGEYPIQVISDRVERYTSDLSQINPEKHTLISSVILKPKFN